MSSITQTLVVPSLKNILFATDFSQCSQLALPYLRTIAERYNSTIHIVHVLAPEPMLEIPLDNIPELSADRDVALSAMKTMLDSKPFGQVAVTTTVKQGAFWPALEELISEDKIDLIVLGTHGRRGLKKLLMGSVAEQVFRLAPCPVLTVGPQSTNEGGEPVRIASILFATDFSSGSQHALAYAVSMARANSSHLILLHSVSASKEIVPASFNVDPTTVELSSKFIGDAIASARVQVTKQISDEIMHELNPEILVECGPAAGTILQIAKSKHADLIVMGAHRAPAGSMASHVPWATVSEVVRQAHCPVLTVRS